MPNFYKRWRSFNFIVLSSLVHLWNKEVRLHPPTSVYRIALAYLDANRKKSMRFSTTDTSEMIEPNTVTSQKRAAVSGGGS